MAKNPGGSNNNIEVVDDNEDDDMEDISTFAAARPGVSRKRGERVP